MADPRVSSGAMASAFEGVIRSVVRELDHGGDLIPVDSLQSSTSFQPYCLLGRKLSRSWFWKPRYKCINLSIRDILEPDAPEPGTPPAGREGTGQPTACSGPLRSLLSKDRPLERPRCPGETGGGRQDWASALVWL